ncbi:hypothetical protein K435DRAFT_833028 [Dendrothele bispora CBS 962.96]|uniref:RING-type domain-containing protein n=1 Tax=Dendrothele bispora (strain CBS 962.96) TaxID=1314807 RepID=A0A4S8MYS6_DENBC|nr:hypothetical protein K435DRAFT_833028 [Dendrothele bispora CBS 962.96]
MDQVVQQFLESLPVLSKSEIPQQESCPICLVPFEDVLNDATIDDSVSGVTKLDTTCGHVFCRKDIVEWVRGMHGSCPFCRQPFLDIRPPSDSDGESSDGGEYVPMDDDEEEEDSFTLDTDGFTEGSDFDVEVVEDIDIGMYQDWREPDDDMGDASSDWLTDGDSFSTSEGDLSLRSEMHVQDAENVAIHEDEGQDTVINLDNEEPEAKD